MNTPAAIVAYFAYSLILPIAVGILGSLSQGFEDAAPWFEFNTAQTPLFSGDYTPTGEQWAQIVVSGIDLAGDPTGAGHRAPPADGVQVAARPRLGAMTAPITEPALRLDGRADDQLRPVTLTRGWLDHAAGSVLVEFGRTRVLCAASASVGVPRWRKGSGLGWVTAEYAMLPAATNTRSDRESVKGRIGGRTHEISRLIGRSLRAVIDYGALGENTIQLDCDVLQADGGTRTAAITGAYVALARRDRAPRAPRAPSPASRWSAPWPPSRVGIIDGVPRLDLPYEEDVRAETDMNVVMTGDGKFVEVQGTAEGAAFDRAELDALLALAREGLRATSPGCSTRRSRVGDAAVFLASRNAKKLAEMQRILARARAGRRGRRARRGGARTPSRSRTSPPSRATRCSRPAPAAPRPACRRSPTTAACASTRSTGCPGCCPRAGRARPSSDDAQQRAAARPARGRARRAAPAPTSRARSPSAIPTAPSCVVHGRMPGRIIRETRGSGGFGYDVRVRRRRAHRPRADLRRAGPGREGPDLAPRPRPARDRARRGGLAHGTATAGRLLTERDTSQPQSAASGNMISEYTAAGTEIVDRRRAPRGR